MSRLHWLHKVSFSHIHLLVFLLAFSEVSIAQNETGFPQLHVTGFVSAVGGQVTNTQVTSDYAGPLTIKGVECPCYIADWANGGMYADSMSFTPESRAGVQASYRITPEFSLTGQLTSRGTSLTPDLQWAYAALKLNSDLELQVGRKRIPLYYYSDFQDVGVSYPWISPPPEIYGWEATNYNGISMRFNRQFNEININASAFTGSEKVKDSSYQQFYFYQKSNNVNWNNLIGADIEINYDALTFRAVYMQAKVETRIPKDDFNSLAGLKAYGVAINFDIGNFFIISELTQLTRDFSAEDYSYRAPAYSIGMGVRIGSWTPFINLGQYKEISSDKEKYQPQAFRRPSFTLRYDIDSHSDIKIQADTNSDLTNNFSSDSRIVRISYDRVFD